jgi:hypothetical protein
VNITNTSVTVTRVTNVYNTVIVNKTTNMTYVNQHVTNGVTVVSHDAFVNARPAAQNMMHVSASEIASAPVSRAVAAEPIRASVVGAGRPVSAAPPAAVINRPVVAVRTPPPPPRSIEQRQAQAGGHLNQQALVRPAGAAQPAQMNQGKPQQNQEGFRSFGQNTNGNPQVKVQPNAQPRTFEAEGNSRPEEPNAQPANRNENGFRSAQPSASQPAHPLVRPAPPVQQRSPEQEQQQAQKFNQWQQQRSASAPPKEQSRPAPKQEAPPPKKH